MCFHLVLLLMLWANISLSYDAKVKKIKFDFIEDNSTSDSEDYIITDEKENGATDNMNEYGRFGNNRKNTYLKEEIKNTGKDGSD